MKSKTAILFASLLCGLVSPLPAVENHWTGGGGDNLWTNSNNWSLARVPLATDDAFIDLDGTYSVTLNNGYIGAAAATFRLGAANGIQTLNITGVETSLHYTDALILSNGVLNIAPSAFMRGSNMTALGTLNWMSGSLSLEGLVTISPEGKLNISGSGGKFLYNRIANYGTVTWNSSGSVIGYDPVDTVFENHGLFILQTNCSFTGSGVFLNTGTILKPADGGTSTLKCTNSFVLTNSGVIEVESNATLELAGTIALIDGSVFTGGGLLRLGRYGYDYSSANIYANGTLTANLPVELTNLGGLWGTQTWTGSGVLNWISGGMFESGTTTIGTNFHLNITGSHNHYLENHTLENFGTVTWNNATVGYYGLTGSGDALFANYGLFVLQSDCNMGGSGAFLNTGTILKPADGGATTLSCNNSFVLTNSGVIEVQSNATLELAGTMALIDGSVFTGGGLLRLKGTGYDYPVANIYANGTLTANLSVELTNFSGLWGTQTWTGSGVLNWSSGGMFDYGTTTIATNFQMNIGGSSGKYLYGHTLENHGTLTWSSSGGLYGYDSALFRNRGLFVIQTNCLLAGSGNLDNASEGLVRHLAGSTVIDWSFTNCGILDLQNGQVSFTGNYVPTATSVHLTPLSGHAPGTDFGYLSLSNFVPNGALIVTLTNGFLPTNGSSFTLVNYTSHTGSFANTQLPSLPQNLDWRIQYAPNALILRIVPASVLSDVSQLSSGNFQFTLTGAAGSGYFIQASTNLIDWIAVEANNPFSGTLTFTDSDATNFSQRFYRASIVP